MKKRTKSAFGMRAMQLLLVLTVLLFIGLNGWGDDTRSRKLKRKPSVTVVDSMAIISPFDTVVAPPAELVMLSGYDKPLRATVETMFVTNRLQRDIVSILLSITYLDMEGHQLHQRDVEVRNSIPAGSTRQIKVKSWDSQKSFYYHRGQKPRVDAVTPYKVNCIVNSCVIDTVI